jgi:O-antigen ligase
MKIYISIALFFTVAILASQYKSKKTQKYLIFILMISFFLKIHLFAFGESQRALVRYETDYIDLYFWDFPILYLGLIGIYNIKNIKAKRTLFLPILYVLLNFLSIRNAFNRQAAISASVRSIELLLLFIYFSGNYISAQYSKYIVKGFTIGVWFETILCIYQKATGHILGLTFLGEVESGFRTHVLGGVETTGTSGTFSHSTELAIYILLSLIVIMLHRTYFKSWITFYATLFAILITTYLSAARTLMLLSFVSVIYVILKDVRISNKHVTVPKYTFYSIIFLFAISIVVFNVFHNKIVAFANSNDLLNSLYIRTSQWNFSMNIIRQRWLLGYGANNFVDDMYHYYRNAYNSIWNYQNPIHNTYLLMWYDLGIFGFIVQIALQIKYLIPALNRKYRISNMHTAMAFFTLVSTFYSMFDWGFLKTPTIFYSWIAFGICQNAYNTYRDMKTEHLNNI